MTPLALKSTKKIWQNSKTGALLIVWSVTKKSSFCHAWRRLDLGDVHCGKANICDRCLKQTKEQFKVGRKLQKLIFHTTPDWAFKIVGSTPAPPHLNPESVSESAVAVKPGEMQSKAPRNGFPDTESHTTRIRLFVYNLYCFSVRFLFFACVDFLFSTVQLVFSANFARGAHRILHQVATPEARNLHSSFCWGNGWQISPILRDFGQAWGFNSCRHKDEVSFSCLLFVQNQKQISAVSSPWHLSRCYKMRSTTYDKYRQVRRQGKS